jgi:hypothetical protein
MPQADAFKELTLKQLEECCAAVESHVLEAVQTMQMHQDNSEGAQTDHTVRVSAYDLEAISAQSFKSQDTLHALQGAAIALLDLVRGSHAQGVMPNSLKAAATCLHDHCLLVRGHLHSKALEPAS